MNKIRHLAWAYREYIPEPADYQYAPPQDILDLDIKHLEANPQDGFSSRELLNLLEFLPESPKQFTVDHLRQLVAARGFTEVMCNWLTPEQVADERIRARITFIQQFLSEIWEIINGR
jgi:hypothetical protein